MKERYEAILSLYNKEEKRREGLIDRIKIYLSIFTFYLGAVAFSLKDIYTVMAFQSFLLKGIWVFTLFLLVLPFFFVIRAFGKKYIYPNELGQILESGELTDSTDEEFYQSRIVYLLGVHEENVKSNDSISLDISKSLKVLAAGIAGSLLVFVSTIFS